MTNHGIVALDNFVAVGITGVSGDTESFVDNISRYERDEECQWGHETGLLVEEPRITKQDFPQDCTAAEPTRSAEHHTDNWLRRRLAGTEVRVFLASSAPYIISLEVDSCQPTIFGSPAHALANDVPSRFSFHKTTIRRATVRLCTALMDRR